MEIVPFIEDKYLLQMVIFHSYFTLPEGMFQWLFCYQSVSLQLGTVGENCLSHPTLGVPSKTDQLLFDFGLW